MDDNDLQAGLSRLAANHRWTWRRPVAELLDDITAGDTRHPYRAVADLEAPDLAVIGDPVRDLVRRELSLLDEIEAGTKAPRILYLSPEFGVSERLPQYSGGLGVLAGDHLKAASDAELPLAGVGLFYRQGFFRQDVVGGRQRERYETLDPRDLGGAGTSVSVTVPLAGRDVRARVWEFRIGRVRLLVLDTDVEGNEASDRAITDRLYGGDRRHRLEQEMVLGVGGMRAALAMGWDPDVIHLNEGHAGFALLELLARNRERGADPRDVLAAIRDRVLFTTHTPVPAGIDRFGRDLLDPYLHRWEQPTGIPVDELAALGRDPEHGLRRFNMAAFCLRGAHRANGVSALHETVSRRLFEAVEPKPTITHVTNGVHARTWVDGAVQDLFDRRLGPGWDLGHGEAWTEVDAIDDDEIRVARGHARRRLAEVVAAQGQLLDPDAMVVGFARRFAAYKRADLLLRHRDRLEQLLADPDRPVHLVYAGKAHPADEIGKGLMASVVGFASSPAANGRFTFLADYDMRIGRALCAGSDVWLNHPVRPREASGTSGEKAALNGVLNCSVRDGWWDEMSDGRNGWDIPTSASSDPEQRDDEESAAILELLASIAAEFGSGENPSPSWIGRMRHAWRTLGPRVTAARMISDYDEHLYRPMLARP